MVNKYHNSKIATGHKEHLINVKTAVNQVRGSVNILKGKGTLKNKMKKLDEFNEKTRYKRAKKRGK
jgi:hypothetical protein